MVPLSPLVPPEDARGLLKLWPIELPFDGAYKVPEPTPLGKASSMASIIFLALYKGWNLHNDHQYKGHFCH